MQPLKRKQIIVELVVLTLVSIAVISGVREFVARPFITSGDSMSPAFVNNEYLVIDELAYIEQVPQRGDVVVFRYPLDPSIFFIKRIIGIPGDKVTITDGVVSVQQGGKATSTILSEPYVAPQNRKKESSTISLTVDEYFMLGDNRSASSDSRTWGPVPGRYIIGRPVLRVYPFDRIALWPGDYRAALLRSASTTLSTPR